MKKIILQTIVDIDQLKGFKIHKFNNRNLSCFEIPRNLIKFIKNITNIENSGIYFLINEDNNGLYVGQTDNIYNRINDHNRGGKEFNKVLCFVTDNNNLSKTLIDYLEWHYIAKLKKGNSWRVMNEQQRDKKPNVNEFEEIILLDIITDIDILLFCNSISFHTDKSTIFKNRKAKAIFEEGKLTILAGSILPSLDSKKDNIKADNTYYKEQIKNVNDMLIQFHHWEQEGVVVKSDDGFKVLIDIKLWSPSKASNYARGLYATSGWQDWKNDEGQTLDDVYRKA